MPKLTGTELAEEARRLRPGLPVILCTGYSDKLNDKRGSGAHLSRVLLKPFSISEMMTAINQALKKD
jgi:CheY-like chemotaxis protein